MISKGKFLLIDDVNWYDLCNTQKYGKPHTSEMLVRTSKPATVFGARLRSRRQELGLSQEKVGVSIGLDESCSRTRISRYETGAHEPALATSRLLAIALGVPLAYLYCEDDNMAEIIRLTDKLEIESRRVFLDYLQRETNNTTT